MKRNCTTRHPTAEQVEGALQTFKVVHPPPEVQEHHPSADRATAPLEPSPTAAYKGNNDPLLDAKGAAAYLGLAGVVKHPAQCVRSLFRKRRIRCTTVAGRLMARRSWLDAYLEANTREAVNAPGTGDRVP
ncbi:MAG: hypothetical protein V2A79_05215 [Planctomycetota bacterium]